MNPAGPLFHKPKSFISAKNLLYTSICVGFLTLLLHKLVLGSSDAGILPNLVSISIEYVVLFIIVKQMGQCKKWARDVLSLLCVFIAASYFSLFKIESKVSMAEVALFVLQAAFQLIAIGFLYTKESNTWFNSKTDGTLP